MKPKTFFQHIQPALLSISLLLLSPAVHAQDRDQEEKAAEEVPETGQTEEEKADERAKEADERAKEADERKRAADERAREAAERNDAKRAEDAAKRAQEADERARRTAERAKDAAERARRTAERAKDAAEKQEPETEPMPEDDPPPAPGEEPAADPAPVTEKPEPVETEGTENSMISSDDILFLQGSTQFSDPYSYEIVAALAEAMKQMPEEERFVIEGHASAEGSYDSNMTLSQQRAETIVRDMVRRGVSAYRLLPVGYGESEARHPADAAEHLRSQDRRVVVFRMQPEPVAQR